MMANLSDVGHQAGKAAKAVGESGVFRVLTRVGFASKGVVYLLVGVLALMAAFGNGGATTDKKGAVSRIAGQPFGEFALIVIGLGLLGYAMWRYMCAFADADGEGSSAGALAKRAGYFFSGVVHTSLAFYALRIVTGSGGGEGNSEQSLTARLLQVPAGKWLIVLLGALIIAAGIEQLREGLLKRFMKHLRTGQMNREETAVALRAGRWGYSARGVVFAITGAFLVYAGWTADPAQARGLEGVLDAIASKPFGQLMLGLVAAGLACYGVYCFVAAKYRRVSL